MWITTIVVVYWKGNFGRAVRSISVDIEYLFIPEFAVTRKWWRRWSRRWSNRVFIHITVSVNCSVKFRSVLLVER